MLLIIHVFLCVYRIAVIGEGKNWRKCTIQLLAKLILANCTCTVCDTPTSNHYIIYRQVLSQSLFLRVDTTFFPAHLECCSNRRTATESGGRQSFRSFCSGCAEAKYCCWSCATTIFSFYFYKFVRLFYFAFL